MSVIIIPRRHLVQPQGRVMLVDEWGAAYAYAPWMSRDVLVGAGGGASLLGQTSMSGQLVSSGGVGTTYAAQAAGSGPTIEGYPFALAAAIEVLPASGNVYAEAALGVGNTGVSSPASIGVTSGFTGDARPSYRVGGVLLSRSESAHASVFMAVAVSYSATQHALYVGGRLVAESSATATMLQAGAPNLAVHAVREYNFGSWNSTNANLRLLGGAWFRRALSPAEAYELSRNLWQIFRADPIRIYSLPSGAITLGTPRFLRVTSSGFGVELDLS